MDKHDGKSVRMTQPTPIIGQRFLQVDIPAEARKIPERAPLPLAGLFHGDKQQLDRLEAKLDRLLALFDLLNSDKPLPLGGEAVGTALNPVGLNPVGLNPVPKLET